MLVLLCALELTLTVFNNETVAFTISSPTCLTPKEEDMLWAWELPPSVGSDGYRAICPNQNEGPGILSSENPKIIYAKWWTYSWLNSPRKTWKVNPNNNWKTGLLYSANSLLINEWLIGQIKLKW